jgi:hypothetical protein
MAFSQDFREFIKLLNSNNVEYLLAGGYAIAVHGYPKNAENANRFMLLQVIPNVIVGLISLSQLNFRSCSYKYSCNLQCRKPL